MENWHLYFFKMLPVTTLFLFRLLFLVLEALISSKTAFTITNFFTHFGTFFGVRPRLRMSVLAFELVSHCPVEYGVLRY